MNIKNGLRNVALGGCVMMTGLMVDLPTPGVTIVRDAEARIGRPATPGSVAGVARRTSRRTTRRVMRRTSMFVATLPAGCRAVTIDGYRVHQCGGRYYYPSGNQYVVVVFE